MKLVGLCHLFPLLLVWLFKVNLMRMKKRGKGKKGRPVPMASRRHVKEVRTTQQDQETKQIRSFSESGLYGGTFPSSALLPYVPTLDVALPASMVGYKFSAECIWTRSQALFTLRSMLNLLLGFSEA